MVFFGKNYWTQTLPAESLLEALFKNNNRGQEYKDNVLVTSDENQTIDFIVSTRYTPEDAPALISEQRYNTQRGSRRLSRGKAQRSLCSSHGPQLFRGC